MIYPSQAPTVELLSNLLEQGGGFLLTGPEGIGKSAVAEEAVAKLFSIRTGGDHPGLCRIMPDETKATKTIGVEQVRALIQTMQHTAAGGVWRNGLVLPADAMTPAAANALLKTLEEPPAKASILLVAHRPSRLPATIRSRCRFVPCPVPTREESLQRIMSEAGADKTRAMLAGALNGWRPGAAIRFLQSGADENYNALVRQLASSNPFARDTLMSLSRGMAKDFESGKQAIMALLWRASLLAGGTKPEAVSEIEEKALKRVAGRGNGADTAWRIVHKIADDTSAANLDQNYATYRMLLAIEHGAS